ncbi:hypothetical protein A2291_08270 [candidate division WOR-1 bacterium RIFOXYB2_FULL_42_35]|uniref:Homoserine dehydrogenase n=1 Tax=candidate division WOR-1 bacterium RIFOXYC2_FULL_41_25 TaxID=1802586 RepID=A0A1F4TMC4_UNCSA|nr:MAG: hypothetical protein A2247_04965 [candidate division WOR-1 bacterium RIFOXYA2_FULL_41_14]OGC23844.1 MAG: hypothetical protein A2291_08270 [candidate division WOR-1 bacterium RIFOXYB2_FULL_42_35]OGC33719.1 MAG: hypothetical protein A2462_00360 [candidate division WOR-1 bacterium RIFOXYC2_FULL_41_25]OGC42660.1 MAG: hypothetical protein A2548_05075 [candidate division WOR-1 bacterium RIFOXYD2_FULL_41_8]
MSRKITIGIIGLGNIGSALAGVLSTNHQVILRNSGVDIRVKKVCDIKKRKTPFSFTSNPYDIINDPEIDVVVECIGGVNPALKLVLAALYNSKHVVTPNKELVAKHMKQLQKVAGENKVSLMFEASVGGGIPIIQPIKECLPANNITEIYGIVNGTTNYILSQMTEAGKEFSDALKEAQAKGYAEPNPSADINGNDAAYKAAILASVAFQIEVNMKDVYFEGITKVAQEDIQYAADIGYLIKLLAITKKVGKEVEIRVHPTLVPKWHPLAAVSDNYNAIYVKGTPMGELMFYGQGAGGGPTASALVADLISIAHCSLPITHYSLLKSKIRNISQVQSRYYIRLQAPDRYGVLAGISKAFAKKKVSIAAVVQKEMVGNVATIVIMVHTVAERNLKAALAEVKKLSVVRKVCNVIRIV